MTVTDNQIVPGLFVRFRAPGDVELTGVVRNITTSLLRGTRVQVEDDGSDFYVVPIADILEIIPNEAP